MAEGTRLLSEYGVYRSIEGSNPSLSAGFWSVRQDAQGERGGVVGLRPDLEGVERLVDAGQ